jgi:hypothetical protein
MGDHVEMKMNATFVLSRIISRDERYKLRALCGTVGDCGVAMQVPSR